jgi:hypothetical protein
MAITVNESMMDRVERALRQHMYKMEETVVASDSHRIYKVMGSTGNVYTVSFQPEQLSCDCHDFAFNNKGAKGSRGRPCKHIYFVHLRILKAKKNNPIVYTCSPSQAQLARLFEEAPVNPVDKYQASPAAQEAYRNAVASAGQLINDSDEVSRDFFAFKVTRRPFEGQDCPICLETMENASNDPMRPLIWCEKQCGQSCHRDCAIRWASQHGETQLDKAPCVWCRYINDDIYQQQSAHIASTLPSTDEPIPNMTNPLRNRGSPTQLSRSGAFLNLAQYQPDLSANSHVARLIQLSDTQPDDVMDLCTDEYEEAAESDEKDGLVGSMDVNLKLDKFGEIPYDTLVAAVANVNGNGWDDDEEGPQDSKRSNAKRKQDRFG